MAQLPNKARVLDSEHPEHGANLRVPCLTGVDEERIRELLERKRFFWLDLVRPSPQEVERLGVLLGLHPLAIEDTLHSNQRPKIDDFDDHVFMVFYGARHEGAPQDEPVYEVDLFISGAWLVTIHDDPLPALEEQRSLIEGRVVHSEQFVVYRVLDALTDTYFPALAAIDEQIDELEEGILEEPSNEQLQRIFRLKRELVAMRRVLTPQRDLLVRGVDTIADLPGLQLDERDYFRDVYDHVIRISDLIDSYRDLLSGAMDAYLSTVANRQNEVMKQLTVIATIFLPLTFLTGFFGMNFSYLTGEIENTLASFLALGLGSCALSVLGLWIYFRRKRWT